ncbi:CGNR zinc finger domain-containing protein [Tengunoibacter tsumagoiensis]|uniref:RNA-binding protein n=1 Tax=Tengunoibacter tsumagoiensis TaxID=2014871 RepID=A0A401ZYP3_9CHLR|nr:ABATE domain-containing protein [Tengunoibacter tsumagoiensis]GCE11942.1 RNA-binding protein [Tengunoibacter tsumagoiensis]
MKESKRHQNASNQKETSDERNPFIFLGGNLALDLVNTEYIVRGKRADRLLTPVDATQWWEMAQQMYSQTIQHQESRAWSEQQVSALRRLRQMLRDLFETIVVHHQAHENQIEELNSLLRLGSYMLEIGPEGNFSAHYRMRDLQGSEVLFSIAWAAMDLLTKQELGRLHACQNKRCMVLFYDTTKSATRHWCSIACSNRARSLQNYRQTKNAP